MSLPIECLEEALVDGKRFSTVDTAWEGTRILIDFEDDTRLAQQGRPKRRSTRRNSPSNAKPYGSCAPLQVISRLKGSLPSNSAIPRTLKCSGRAENLVIEEWVGGPPRLVNPLTTQMKGFDDEEALPQGGEVQISLSLYA
jgi:hypothetical protein